ncbi:hypothetical protein PHLGIDRAFT_502048 [Phlebiopsis gigantea 11061_1 CR5-6]|uniref:Uncharacterized protein n=1 Tax=Phlebiopsis gigantea (strain 11061_1 CR5-6) TaxID=745531 RepID=A0A0C3S0B6_PHLG1|nr:hypothetical protein PHLGIDRAFT_502048 [Phlebiopsis gigantea 11061_1 CR5-6]
MSPRRPRPRRPHLVVQQRYLSCLATQRNHQDSSDARTAIIAGVTGSVGGVAILLGLAYLFLWCRKRQNSRDSIVSTDPLWQKNEPEMRESFGNGLSLLPSALPLRRGHSSGMAMVSVSDDPFGITPPSFPQTLNPPPIIADSAPLDSLYSETPSSTMHLVFLADQANSSPGGAQRAFPVIPAIRIQSASTNDYAGDDHRSSYAESMVPLETPDDNFPNPFADPADYIVPNRASTETVNLPPSPQSTQSESVFRGSPQALLASRTNSRLTMSSLRAEVVPSPVDTIDRFWDLPGPYAASQLSAATPTSSESLLRSVSPGPGPTSRSGYS